MANFSLGQSPLFEIRPDKIQPEVELLHNDLGRWSSARFEEEWSKHFSKADWRKLTIKEIVDHTGIEFDGGAYCGNHLGTSHVRVVSHPNLHKSPNRGMVPRRGIPGATVAESRGRYLLFLTLVRSVL